MSRPLRIKYPGAIYHITTRGNARKKIFLHDKDRNQFLFLLMETLKKYNWLCHTYCLMGNHYHLLVETVDPTLSTGMRNLNGMYTQWHHAEHSSVGHIFQGRFKAFLIEDSDYFFNVARYIVLNPVRANMADDPADYSWSSYRAMADLEPTPSWLTTTKILTQFNNRKIPTEKQYKSFVHQGIGLPSPFLDVKGLILGSDQFISEQREMIEDQNEIKAIVTAERMDGRPTLEQLFAEINNKRERDATIVLAISTLQYSGAEVGRFLNLDVSTICKIAKRPKH